MGGLLGLKIQEVYERFSEDGKVEPFNWYSMRSALSQAQAEGFLDRVIDDVPVWAGGSIDAKRFWGFPSWESNLAWFSYVRMALDAGYYGFAFVDFDRSGPQGSGTDHIVLVCGHRERREKHATIKGVSTICPEILISCSATKSPEEEWVHHHEFLSRWGGYNLLLARPT